MILRNILVERNDKRTRTVYTIQEYINSRENKKYIKAILCFESYEKLKHLVTRFYRERGTLSNNPLRT